MIVEIYLKSSPLRAVSLRLHSALGAPLRTDLEISSAEPLDGEALLGTPARLEITGDEGSIAIHHSILASLTAVATANPDAQRKYTLDIRSVTRNRLTPRTRCVS